MNFIYFIVFSLIVFLSLLLGGKKFRSTALYALAIGGVVNANFFHAEAFPIECFELPFGIDSIIYTLFIFCVIVMQLKQDYKSAYLLAFSSIIAIMFSAIMQLVAELFIVGSSIVVWNTFLTFIISSISSVITVIAMIEILKKLKGKCSDYVLIIIGITIATVINTGIYFPVITLLMGTPNNILSLTLASFIGKMIAMLCALLTYFLINLYDKKYCNK